MSYWETLLVILRRWRISVPAMLLAVGVGVGAFYVTPPQYEDTSQVLFLGSPVTPGEKTLVNPYLELGSTLVSTADVIRLKVGTSQIAESLAASGATAPYGVALDQSTPAPVLIVTTDSTDQREARGTTIAVVKQIQSILEDLQRQAGAPPSTWVRASVISSLPEPKRKLNASVRPGIVATGGVFAATMFVLFLLEGRQRRRETAKLFENGGPQAAGAPPPARPVAPAPAALMAPDPLSFLTPGPPAHPAARPAVHPADEYAYQPQHPATPQHPPRHQHPPTSRPEPEPARTVLHSVLEPQPDYSYQYKSYQYEAEPAYEPAPNPEPLNPPNTRPAPTTREVPLLKPVRPVRHERSGDGPNGANGSPNGSAAGRTNWPS